MPTLPPGYIPNLSANLLRPASGAPSDRTHVVGTVDDIGRLGTFLDRGGTLSANLGDYSTLDGAIVVTNRKPSLPIWVTYRKVNVTYPGPSHSYEYLSDVGGLDLDEDTATPGTTYAYRDSIQATLIPPP